MTRDGGMRGQGSSRSRNLPSQIAGTGKSEQVESSGANSQPGGRQVNSPALQCWATRFRKISPVRDGRIAPQAMREVLSSLWDSPPRRQKPSTKVLGYFLSSLRDFAKESFDPNSEVGLVSARSRFAVACEIFRSVPICGARLCEPQYVALPITLLRVTDPRSESKFGHRQIFPAAKRSTRQGSALGRAEPQPGRLRSPFLFRSSGEARIEQETLPRFDQLKLRDEFLDVQSRLFENTLQCPWLDGLVLRNDDGPVVTPQNDMGASLADADKSQTLQCPHRFRPVDIARQLHTKARMGSSTKCNRTCVGWLSAPK